MSSLTEVVSRARTLANATRPIAALALRVSVGTVFLSSGWGKLHALEGVVAFFRDLGLARPELLAPFVAGVELVGGGLLLLGLGTRLVVLPLSVTMLVAIASAKWAGLEGVTDFWGLSEVDYLVMFLALFAFGAGPLSVDGLFARWLKRGLVEPTVRPAPATLASPG